MVQVAVGGAAGDQGSLEIGPQRSAHVLEGALATAAEVPEDERRLLVVDARLDSLDLLFEVAVGGEDVLPAVQVVVEEEDPEGEGQEARLPHRGLGRSEEHTSELQSRRDLVCRLLLEKKKF